MAAIFKRRVIIGIIVAAALAIAAFYILPVSVPLILALLSAMLLEPIVKLLQKKTPMKRKMAVLTVFIIFTIFLGSALFFSVTKVVGEAIKVIETAPQYANDISHLWDKYEEDFKAAAKDWPKEMVEAITEEVNNFLTGLKDSLRKYVNIERISTFLSYIPNYLVSFLVYLIALFMFMLELPRLKSGIYSHLTDKTAEKVTYMSTQMSRVIFGFFKAQFLVSILIFIVALIGLLIIQPRTALVMAIIIWIIDLIPIIGSIVILGPWAIYHLLAGNLLIGVQLSILAVVLLIIRRTVEPKVMGSHMGLSPLATLIAMYLGLQLLGIVGLIVGPLLLILFKSAKEAGIIRLNFKI